MEPLPNPPPFSFPPNDDLRVAWELLHHAIQSAGASPTAIEDLPATAKQAGFDLVRLGGSCQPTDPATGFELHAATTSAVRDQIVASGASTTEEIDAIIDRLRTAATSGGFRWVTSPLSLTVTLRDRDR
jgi:hypothetical protein